MQLVSDFCIFHDKDYLQDKTNYEEHRRAVLDRLKHKVNHAISNNEPLLCIGFHLPDFSLSDLSINKKFTRSVYFNGSQFFGEAFFAGAQFHGQANFLKAKFQEVSFYGAHFLRLADFGTANFHGSTSFLESHFHGLAWFNGAH
jgi:uncharacterized protein YjbI with pentapeptide repeats